MFIGDQYCEQKTDAFYDAWDANLTAEQKRSNPSDLFHDNYWTFCAL